jgi:hypothetical protein
VNVIFIYKARRTASAIATQEKAAVVALLAERFEFAFASACETSKSKFLLPLSL